MTRNHQTAAFSLLASAIVLAGMTLYKAGDMLESKAQAEMVTGKGLIQVMTTTYRRDAEIVYVLDSRREVLLAYLYNPQRKQIELLKGGTMSIGAAFKKAAAAKGGGVKGPRRRIR